MTGKGARRGGDGRGEARPGVLRRGELEADEGRLADRRPAAQRRAMERAALELSGEVGFAGMTVAALIERSGSNLDRFYRTYGDKSRCYAAAYATAMDELAAGVLAACAGEPRWADGMRAALAWFADLVEAEPNVVRGLLGESRAADGWTKGKRQEVFERLTGAIDRARREADAPRHAPPPLTSAFILFGIETSVLRLLDRPDDADPGEWLAGAVYVAVDLYRGGAAAREQVRRLGRAS